MRTIKTTSLLVILATIMVVSAAIAVLPTSAAGALGGQRIGFWVADDDIFTTGSVFGLPALPWTPQQFYDNYFNTPPYPATMLWASGLVSSGAAAVPSDQEAQWLSQVASLADGHPNIKILVLLFVNLSGNSIETFIASHSACFTVKRQSPLTQFNVCGLSASTSYNVVLEDVNHAAVATISSFMTNSTGGFSGTFAIPNELQTNNLWYIVVSGTSLYAQVALQSDQSSQLNSYMNNLKGHSSIFGALFEPEYFGNTAAIQATFRSIITGAGYQNLVGISGQTDPMLAYSSYPYFGGTLQASPNAGQIGIHYGETGIPLCNAQNPCPIWTQSTVLDIVDRSTALPCTIIMSENDVNNPAGNSYLWASPTLRGWIWNDSYYRSNYLLANAGYQVSPGSKTTVSCSPQTVMVGSSVICKVSVTGSSPGGIVSWSLNGSGKFSRGTCRLSGGTCSVRFYPASAGQQVAITTSYQGDGKNPPSSGGSKVSVAPKASVTRVVCKPATLVGATSTEPYCKATVKGYRPTGIVSWSQSGLGSVSLKTASCILSKSSCSVSLVGSSAGSVSIKATYEGDSNNTVSSWVYKVKVASVSSGSSQDISFSSYSLPFTYGQNFQTAGNSFQVQVPRPIEANMIAFYFSDRAYDTNAVPFTITDPSNNVLASGTIPALLQFSSQSYYPIQLSQVITLQPSTTYTVRFSSLPAGDTYGIAGISQDILQEAATSGGYLGQTQWPIFQLGLMNLQSQSSGMAYHNYGAYTDLFSSPGYQSTTEIAMRFQAAQTERLISFEVAVISSDGSSNQLTFTLRSDSGGHPTPLSMSPALDTASVTASQVSSNLSIANPAFVKVYFSGQPQLTAGTNYWLVMSEPSGVQSVVLGRLVNAYREYVLASSNDYVSWGVPADGPTDLGFRITTTGESIINTVSGSSPNNYFSGVAQSFIPSTGSQVKGAWLAAKPNGQTMTVSIQSDNGNDQPSGNILASGSSTVTSTQFTSAQPFIYVGFTSYASLSVGTKYWLVATIGPCISSCSSPTVASTLSFRADYSTSGFAPTSGTHYEILSGSSWSSPSTPGAMNFALASSTGHESDPIWRVGEVRNSLLLALPLGGGAGSLEVFLLLGLFFLTVGRSLVWARRK